MFVRATYLGHENAMTNTLIEASQKPNETIYHQLMHTNQHQRSESHLKALAPLPRAGPLSSAKYHV